MAEGDRKPLKVVILVIVVIALGISIGYQVLRSNPEDIVPVSRTPFDFDVNWRCLDCGYKEVDKAAVGPKPCPKCGKESLYASTTWFCARHGAVQVAIQYNDEGDPIEVKVGKGPWKPSESGVRCPRCNGSMQPGG
jgi:hypothetical protein